MHANCRSNRGLCYVKIVKIPNSGGVICRESIIEQIPYETTDPTSYIFPNVIVDFTELRIDEVGKGVVKILGFKGHPKPEYLKVVVGFMEGLLMRR